MRQNGCPHECMWEVEKGRHALAEFLSSESCSLPGDGCDVPEDQGPLDHSSHPGEGGGVSGVLQVSGTGKQTQFSGLTLAPWRK